jgi:hypothetical protein
LGIPRHAGIREHDIELAFLLLDLGEQPIEVVNVRHVSRNADSIPPDLLRRRRQLRLASPGNEDGGAFVHELSRSRETDAAVCPGD